MLGALRRIRRVGALTLTLTACSLGFGAATAYASLHFLSVEPDFMCTSCHEPLELVSSPQALSEKAYLRGLVNRGLTLGEIKSEMVGQYGEEVLAQPPASGFNLTVYVLPPLVVLVGLLTLAYTLPKWRRRSKLAAQTSLPGSDPLKPEEAERLDAELDQFI